MQIPEQTAALPEEHREAIIDAADEWAQYVTEDHAPLTLRAHMQLALAALATTKATAPAKSLDDPKLQQLFGDAIEGALAFGFQGNNAPPEGHWLWRFWNIGNAERTKATAPVAAESKPSNWHRHHVAVEKAAVQMIRNALRTDAESGRSVRAEMLEMFDAATSEIPAPPPVEAIGEPVAVISEPALKKLADGTARCVHAYAKVVDEDDVKLYRGTPATPSSQDAPRAVPAGLSDAQIEEIEGVVACLGDDAASLREDNPEDERAANMERAAELLEALAASAPGAKGEKL